ncbi:hypothetical protein FB451DRAFT_1532686 [Mycena latifolia]|nr:hypothetical protein FB451DRAFT_1532686 [Mycena latifolia]
MMSLRWRLVFLVGMDSIALTGHNAIFCTQTRAVSGRPESRVISFCHCLIAIHCDIGLASVRAVSKVGISFISEFELLLESRYIDQASVSDLPETPVKRASGTENMLRLLFGVWA